VARRQAAVRGVSEWEALTTFTAASALGRLVAPEEIGRTCAFLSSDAAVSIAGEDVNVNAGGAMFWDAVPCRAPRWGWAFPGRPRSVFPVVSTGFIGDRPRGGSRDGHRTDALSEFPVDPVSAEGSGAVARALARTRLRRFVDRPVTQRAVLATFCLTGTGLVIVPGMTMTRLPESLAPKGAVSATGYVLAVVAMACGAVLLALTAVLGGRAVRLGADGHVAAVMRSVAVCASAPEELTRMQRTELMPLLQDVADQLRRLSDATSADRVETSRAVLEGHDDQPDP
jgi:Enoyl-(Acyl carrier protein) reductase